MCSIKGSIKFIFCLINFTKYQMLFRMVEMIEKYKQSVPEEEFAENTVIERGEAKFIVSKINTKDIDTSCGIMFYRKIGFTF